MVIQDPNFVSYGKVGSKSIASAGSAFVRISDRTLLIIAIEERQKVLSHPSTSPFQVGEFQFQPIKKAGKLGSYSR